MFGHIQSDVLGEPLTMLMPERHRAAHTAGIERLKSSSDARLIGRTVEVDGQRQDGSECVRGGSAAYPRSQAPRGALHAARDAHRHHDVDDQGVARGLPDPAQHGNPAPETEGQIERHAGHLDYFALPLQLRAQRKDEEDGADRGEVPYERDSPPAPDPEER